MERQPWDGRPALMMADQRGKTMKNILNWQVVMTCQASKFEPHFDRVVAAFESLVNAEDFIEKVIPEETRGRFCIKNINGEN